MNVYVLTVFAGRGGGDDDITVFANKSDAIREMFNLSCLSFDTLSKVLDEDQLDRFDENYDDFDAAIKAAGITAIELANLLGDEIQEEEASCVCREVL